MVLSIISPFLRREIFAQHHSGTSAIIHLNHIRHTDFELLLQLASGRAVLPANASLWNVLRLAGVADALEMAEAGRDLEDAAVRRLTAADCAAILAAVGGGDAARAAGVGLPRIVAAAHALAVAEFPAAAAAAGFAQIGEEELGALIDDPDLEAPDHVVMAAVAGWMRAANCDTTKKTAADPAGGLPGRGLLAKLHVRRYRRLQAGIAGPAGGS
jgi:hypothetical protein